MKINFNVFKNTRKQKDTHPDYQGNGKDETGKEFDVAGWKKLDKNGNAYISCVIKDKVKKEEGDSF